MLTKQVTLSTLINDCVILAQNAGRVVKSSINGTTANSSDTRTVDKADRIA